MTINEQATVPLRRGERLDPIFKQAHVLSVICKIASRTSTCPVLQTFSNYRLVVLLVRVTERRRLFILLIVFADSRLDRGDLVLLIDKARVVLGLGQLGEVAALPEPHRHLLVRALQVLAHLLCL